MVLWPIPLQVQCMTPVVLTQPSGNKHTWTNDLHQQGHICIDNTLQAEPCGLSPRQEVPLVGHQAVKGPSNSDQHNADRQIESVQEDKTAKGDTDESVKLWGRTGVKKIVTNRRSDYNWSMRKRRGRNNEREGSEGEMEFVRHTVLHTETPGLLASHNSDDPICFCHYAMNPAGTSTHAT